GLERAPPCEQGLAEVARHADGGMNAEVPAEGGVTHTAPGEEAGRVNGAGGDDHPRSPDREPTDDRVARRAEQDGVDADGPAVLDRDALGAAAGVEPCPGGAGGGEIGQVHRLLRIARAAERTLTAAVAADDVAEEWPPGEA